MPPKTASDGGESPLSGTSISRPKGKRQRVSLACDACRSAREKCDSGRPRCQTCVSQGRVCSYTPNSKKRGIPTGYLRTIELSLAWVFETFPQSEAAFLRHINASESHRPGSPRGIGNTTSSDHRLHKRWTTGRANKAITQMLAQGHATWPANMSCASDDPEVEDDEEPPSFAAPTPLSLKQVPSTPNFTDVHGANCPISSSSPAMRLPRHWRRLLDIYYAFTHNWFPILDIAGLMSTASSYSSSGLITTSTMDAETRGRHAELWAALAIAGFQDFASMQPTQDDSLPATTIYSISCDLPFLGDGNSPLSHIRALLLQSLVLLGRGKEMAAWLHIGSACRLAIQRNSISNREPPDSSHNEPSEMSSRVMAGCHFLDTLVSLYFNSPPHIAGIEDGTNLAAFCNDAQTTWEPWKPVAGFGQGTSDADVSEREFLDPRMALHQLHALSRVLCSRWDSAQAQAQRFSKENLVKALRPQFAYCNNLIMDNCTPAIPSGFLVHACFLTATMELVNDRSGAIISTLMEVTESCASSFGPCGTPPIMMLLWKIAQQKGHVDKLHDADRPKWRSMLASLGAVWQQGSLDQSGATSSRVSNVAAGLHSNEPVFPASASHPTARTKRYENNHGPRTMESRTQYANPGMANGFALQPDLSMSRQDASEIPEQYQGVPSFSIPRQQIPAPLLAPSNAGGYPSTAFYGSQPGDSYIDFDAAIEELGAMDCTDSMEVDAQFMMNLGFAPGCDMTEMLDGPSGY